MDIDDFVRLVSRMRTAQNDYFKNRTQSNLIAAKHIEDDVDKALKEGITNPFLDAQQFHPHAMKLISLKRNFLVVDEHELYYRTVYTLIRTSEMGKGTWTKEDEQIYQFEGEFDPNQD